MAGRLAIDFGTSNTVVALWDEAAGEGVPLALPEVGDAGIVPSLIHYAADGTRWLGQQVRRRGLLDSPRTFRWMKRYVAQHSPLRVRLDGEDISPARAGQ